MGVGAICLGGLFSRGFERQAIVALGAGGLLAVLGLVMPDVWSAVRFRVSSPVPGDLKIVQFNVWHSNKDPSGTLNWIVRENADVVVIEEIGGEPGIIMKGLRAAYPYASCAKYKACDTIIFSRLEMRESGVSLASGSDRSISWASLSGAKGAFTVVGTHHSWPLPAKPWQREARELSQIVSRFDPKSAIVAGDFNATPWSFALKRQDKVLGLQRWTHALASWPAGNFSRLAYAKAPLLPIDHIYAGAAWRAVAVKAGPILGSDHRPVVIWLRRRAEDTKPSLSPR